MLFNDIKQILEKTPEQAQAEKQATIQKGKQLSFEELNVLLDKLYYRIECLKKIIKNPDIPENQKAHSKTQLFYYESQKKKVQNKIGKIYFEEYGI